MEHDPALPVGDRTPSPAATRSAELVPRWLAAIEVLLVSGVPTQIAAAAVLVAAFGIPPMAAGRPTLEFIATLSLADTALVAVLIRVFLAQSGERSTEVFLGTRPVGREALLGLLWLPVVFLAVTLLVLAIRTAAPWMHTVDRNPFEAYLRSPLEAAIFLVVVVLAGGVREELQRAFILHRFEQRLGGVRLGLVLFTAVFGLLHVEQGYDVAVAIAALGLFWGLAYVKRRSVVLPMVNHASFNAAQVLQVVLARAYTG